ASALHRTISEVDSMSQEILKTNGVKDAMAMIGFDLFTSSLKENAAAMFIGLQDWKDRNVSADQIIAELNKKFAFDRNASSVFIGLPPIPGLSITGGFEMYVQNKSGKSYDQIQEDVNKLV
ncbi:efflux RND transporter permease subunit, partial [Campylobacter coli]